MYCVFQFIHSSFLSISISISIYISVSSDVCKRNQSLTKDEIEAYWRANNELHHTTTIQVYVNFRFFFLFFFV